MMLRPAHIHIVVLGLIAALAACSSAKTAGQRDGPSVQDARREGLAFRDLPVTPPDDGGDQAATPPPDLDQGTPPKPDSKVPNPDTTVPSPCPTDWSKWSCIDKALLGCTANCGGAQYKLACNALGQCTCDVGGAKKTCPGMPFPPPLPGCAFCSTSLAAKCCESPTP